MVSAVRKFTLGEIGPVRMCKRIMKDETSPDGEIPFFKIGTFGGKADVFISRERYEEYKSKYPYPKRGDVLISAAGTIGRLVVFDGRESYFQDSNIVWVENDEAKATNACLYYALQLARWKPSQGSTILRLYNDDIRAVEFFAPESLTDQGRVASILSAIDRKIALNRKRIATLEAMAKEIYDYWFVQFDFPDAHGCPYKSSGGEMVYNPDLKREIPKGWEVGDFTDLIDFTMGQSPAGSTLNEAGDGVLFYQGATDFGLYFPSPRQFTNNPVRMAKAGDVLLSVRAPVGTLNFASDDCCVGRGLGAFRGKETSNLFVWFYLRSLKPYFDSKNVAGTTFGSIGKDDFKMLKTIIPAKSTLCAYNEVSKNIYKQMMLCNCEMSYDGKLRDFLLPLLMNGQVKVG